MKAILFDIDGVLNHMVCPDDCPHKDKTFPDLAYNFHPEMVARINRITDATGAVLVCASSWRWGRTLDELQEDLKSVGFTAEMVAKVHWLAELNEDHTPKKGVHSWVENEYWIEENKPKAWVILDDNPFAGRDEHFIHVIGGLTDEHVERAIKLLGRN